MKTFKQFIKEKLLAIPSSKNTKGKIIAIPSSKNTKGKIGY